MSCRPLSTSWWTCWTSKPLLTQKVPSPQSSYLRSVQKTGGLFDTDFFTGDGLVAGEYLDGPDDFDLNKSSHVDAFGMTGESDMSDMLGLMADQLQEGDFLDNFVDLSHYLLEDTLTSEIKDEPMWLDADREPCSLGHKASLKRSHEDMVDEVVHATNTDHDYVSKRPKMSPTVESAPKTPNMEQKSPNEKYRDRRNKNNVASKRSRETRKTKYQDMEAEADRLVVENENLKVKIVELEKMAKEMKAALINKLAGK